MLGCDSFWQFFVGSWFFRVHFLFLFDVVIVDIHFFMILVKNRRKLSLFLRDKTLIGNSFIPKSFGLFIFIFFFVLVSQGSSSTGYFPYIFRWRSHCTFLSFLQFNSILHFDTFTFFLFKLYHHFSDSFLTFLNLFQSRISSFLQWFLKFQIPIHFLLVIHLYFLFMQSWSLPIGINFNFTFWSWYFFRTWQSSLMCFLFLHVEIINLLFLVNIVIMIFFCLHKKIFIVKSTLRFGWTQLSLTNFPALMWVIRCYPLLNRRNKIRHLPPLKYTLRNRSKLYLRKHLMITPRRRTSSTLIKSTHTTIDPKWSWSFWYWILWSFFLICHEKIHCITYVINYVQ